MSETATINGRPQRKLLADQLDRLDTIIDALSEGLNGAVADAAREGTRLAVKDAIIEIMTNPELRALLAPVRELASVPAAPTVATVATVASAPAPAVPSLSARMKAKVTGIWAAVIQSVIQAATKAVAAVANTCAAVADTCQAARETVASVGEVLPVRRVLWIAAGVGLAVGLVCLVMPQTAAAAVSAVSVAVNAIAVQAGNRLKRMARHFGLIG